MNFHQLRIFHVVATRHSFTAAAEDLAMTQPAVSLQVKAFEKSLGIKLFERIGNRLLLTQAGEALLGCATLILNAQDEAQRVLSELKGANKGRLVVGTNTTGGMYIMSPILRAFRTRYPEAELVLHIDTTASICERIILNVVDIGFVGGPVDDRRLRCEAFCLDKLALIVSPSHPFACRESVTAQDLTCQPFVVPEPSSRTRYLIERRLREAGVVINIAMQMNGTEAVKKAVEANLGIAMVSRYAIEREVALGVLKEIPLPDLSLTRNMEMLYRSNKYFSPVAKQFRAFVKAYAKERLRSDASAPCGATEGRL